MNEERLSPAWKLACAALALAIATAAGWFFLSLVKVSHDKSLNSQLRILWMDSKGTPLGVVVPAKNRWMENAFVADESGEDSKKIAVLILDDHYRSDDPTLRSESGVIGDPVSSGVLCSIREQADRKHVRIDPAVQHLIEKSCASLRS